MFFWGAFMVFGGCVYGFGGGVYGFLGGVYGFAVAFILVGNVFLALWAKRLWF